MTERIHKLVSLLLLGLMALPIGYTKIAFAEPSIPERTIDYSDDLIEITDFGIYGSDGELLDSTGLDNGVELFDIPSSVDAAPEDLFDSVFEEYRASLISNWGGKRAFAENRLQGIKENLDAEKQRFKSLDSQVKSTQKKLKPFTKEINTLKDQIDLYNEQIAETKDKVAKIELRIAEKRIAIRDLMKKMRRSQVELKAQRKVVLDYISLMYAEEERYLDVYDGGASTIKLLLADASVSETLMGQDYLRVMETAGRELFYDLQKKNRELAQQQNDLQREQLTLKTLYVASNREKRALQEGRIAKADLLEKTQGDEAKFQELLEESIQQQMQSAISIQNMQDNIEFIEEKLALLDDGLETAEQNLNDLQSEAKKTGDFGVVSQVQELVQSDVSDSDSEKTALKWPIPPVAVTTYFRDPTYPKKWGVHNAMDLRAKMFTPIKAPADGYVVETKDNGQGYSYIILAHKGNLMTVYGHVSEIIAKPGTIVKAGDVIGLTGGRPGTKGAGLRTTGPHLHFEVYYKGEVVNPLNYLPVAQLPIEYIPNEYLKVIGGSN